MGSARIEDYAVVWDGTVRDNAIVGGLTQLQGNVTVADSASVRSVMGGGQSFDYGTVIRGTTTLFGDLETHQGTTPLTKGVYSGFLTTELSARPDFGVNRTSVPVEVTEPFALPPGNANICAQESQICVLPAGAAATVWYGAGANWFMKTGVTGSIACTNAAFGDPLRGVAKGCRSVLPLSPVGAALLPGIVASLVDSAGGVWTLGTSRRGSDYEVLRNGGPSGGWAQRLQVAPDGSVWALAAVNFSWWRYDGSNWVWQAAGLPSTVGSSLLPGAVGGLVDKSLVVWSFGVNRRNADYEILRNGVSNGGWALRLQVARDGSVWAQSSDGSWWLYSGSTWQYQPGQP